MTTYAKALLITSAVFGLIGVMIGSHMAGAGSYAMRTFHAHMLVSGFLTTMGWGIFYQAFKPATPILARIHVFSAIIGSVSLNLGMYLYQGNPFGLPELALLLFYIIGGTIYMIAFIAFFLIVVKLKTTD
ncbi:hypothetical protein [Salisediminibacterium selenitireducens]|uniref:Uncharacterized protein n=1 Tax=Bacillus selenitireducens (strain ATCC 700615 / DSM 15326 / MLS10) TaxID=439292 RepID=D6XZ91_BACIE|nr:hypothetical protein [Salisediminibacterium selenitireducens]ADI00376.1 hypothetical protein Bsel_2887 [[Bacillus] selenitireducens MLS10]